MSDARLREAEPPPRDAAAGCGIRRLWKSLGSDIVQNRTVARSERFELPTLGFEVRCSIQLSYERASLFA
jgi:hypothetical protein